ncbi:MAG: LysR family transcriptional regulator [Coxiellaceae bacterium]|nr:LysR family transcriptional regulator [Coxiellaceae bacterium]
MLSLDQLQLIPVFISVAEHSSFSQAALALDLSNASVGNKIKQLENSLGVSLFHRTTRSVSLTQEGQQLLNALNPIAKQLSDIEQNLTSRSDQLSGIIRMTAPPQFGSQCLPELMHQFQQDYPDVTFDITLSNKNHDLLAKQLDLAIRGAHFDQQTTWDSNLYRARTLFTQRIIACATTQYIKSHPVIKTVSDLNQHKALIVKNSHGQPIKQWTFRKGGKPYPIQFKQNVTANSLDLLINACCQHMGILITSELSVQRYIDKGSLIQILPDYQLPRYKLHAIYPRHSNINKRLRAWINHLVQNLTE